MFPAAGAFSHSAEYASSGKFILATVFFFLSFFLRYFCINLLINQEIVIDF